MGPVLKWDSSLLYATGAISIFSGQLGDFTQDGFLTTADIGSMLKALTDLSDYQADNGISDFSLRTFGDLNGDGFVTNRDIQSLLNLLAAAGNGAVGVPEPTSVLSLMIGAILCVPVARRRLRRFV